MSDEKRIIAVDGSGGVAILAGTKALLFIADDIYADPMSVPDDAWREITGTGDLYRDASDTSSIIRGVPVDRPSGNRRERRAAVAKGRKRK